MWDLPRRSHSRKPFEAELARFAGVMVPLVTGALPAFLAAPAAQRQAHLPRPRIHRGILDGGFVVNRVRSDQRKSLDDVRVVAEEVAHLIEPVLSREAGDIDDERVPFPPPA